MNLTGQTLVSASGQVTCTIIGSISRGGQGEVFRGDWSGHAYALKWYHAAARSPQQADLEKRNLKTLLQRDAPSPAFLWPIDFFERPDGFGYLMPLLPPAYLPMASLPSSKPSQRTLYTVALQLCRAFLSLHAEGWCYSDISNSNIFFHPETGEVLIIGIDNISTSEQQLSTVEGTPLFMAPELVCRRGQPNAATDLHSLAVLLFLLMFEGHPLDGGRHRSVLDAGAESGLDAYGHDPLFVFHPTDPRNRPDPREQEILHVHWENAPGFLRDLFTRTFTEGLSRPALRAQESEWIAAFLQMRDRIFLCQNERCQEENLYNPEKSQREGRRPRCWNCATELGWPPRLRLKNGHIVLLHPRAELLGTHLDPFGAEGLSTVLARVEAHPQLAGVHGLRNLSTQRWHFIPTGGEPRAIEPERSLNIAQEGHLDFGSVWGELRR
jgi:DNA-binding helix-hairpin-helix protein with protein kinase domain